MHIDLRGTVAVVTGAGRGIGQSICLALAKEDVVTIGLDVSDEALAETHAQLIDIGPANGTYACDVRDAARIGDVVNDVIRDHGRVDLLVNNAGVVGNGPIDGFDETTWDYIHDVNLKGTFLMCQAVIPTMKRQRRGRIVNAASFAAISPRVGSIAYATSKAAVAHFTRGLAGELGPWGITVNAYAPGMIPTEMNHFAQLPDDEQSQLLDTLTLRRWGSADDIAHLITFLASDQAGYITGTLIDISGGKLATQFPFEAYDVARSRGESHGV